MLLTDLKMYSQQRRNLTINCIFELKYDKKLYFGICRILGSNYNCQAYSLQF
jgi:hypothetical protein